MDNNNTIPYGAVTWENDRSAKESHQRTERQARNWRPPSLPSNGAMFSFTRPSSSRFSVNPHTPHNSIVTGAFDGLRNSSGRLGQPSSAAHISSLQEPDVTNLGLAPGYHSGLSTSNALLHGSAAYGTPARPQAAGFAASSHSSMNLFPPNTSWCHSTTSSCMNLPDLSRQNFRAEGLGYPQAGVARSKRKIATEPDNESLSPAKQFLTERMAAKMYNLSISNDIGSSRKSPSRLEQLDSGSPMSSVGALPSINQSHMEQEQDGSEEKANRNDIPTFVLASGVKEALKKSDSILPDAIVRHVNTPCLALIPWKPANNLPFLSMNLNKKETSKILQKSYGKNNTCVDEHIVVDQDVLGNPARMPLGTSETFPLEDDDMDL